MIRDKGTHSYMLLEKRVAEPVKHTLLVCTAITFFVLTKFLTWVYSKNKRSTLIKVTNVNHTIIP